MITLHQNDIPADLDFGAAVAVDTESMGLNVKRDRLCVVQLSAGDGTAHLVQFFPSQYNAPNLCRLLTNPKVIKLFHYARADLAMLKHYLGVMTTPVYCTKIASALVRTYTERHGLKDLVRELLSVDLSKEQQSSDWGAPTLGKEQMTYAASDVLHLHALREKLNANLEREGRMDIAQACFNFLPARAELDLAGWEQVDIFAHRPTQRHSN